MIGWIDSTCSWFGIGIDIGIHIDIDIHIGIGIGIGIAVNDSQQSNGMSSDLIRSDPIPANTLYHHDLQVYMRIRIECVMKQTYSDLLSR